MFVFSDVTPGKIFWSTSLGAAAFLKLNDAAENNSVNLGMNLVVTVFPDCEVQATAKLMVGRKRSR